MKLSLRSWLWRVPVDQEVDEELAFHLEMRTRELVERGMDPETARAVAISRLGDLASLRRACLDLGRKRDRHMRRTQWFEEFRDDVKFALRQLRRAPGFAVVAAITLALGLGANSAIFALVDTTLLRPLPFEDSDRLVMVWDRTATTPRGRVSPLNLADWNQQNRTFDLIGGFIPNVGGMVMNGADGTAETVPRQWVNAGIFEALGVKPIAGRTFLPSDEIARANVVVLSEAFWQTRFARDPGVVGRDIRLDGMPFTVVGVVPDDFELIGRSSIWALVSFDQNPALRGIYGLYTVGRLRPGVSIDAAAADLNRVADRLAQEFPQTNSGRGVTLESLHSALFGSDLRRTSVLFLGVVGFVLLICCANVANLLLARATERGRELAVRSALGAGRWRVVRQLVTESLVLATIGGVLGVAVGALILNAAPPFIPPNLLPGAITIAFDARVVAFCAAAALFVGLLFGLVPAWQATEFSSAHVAGAGSRSTTGRGGKLRDWLVAGEVATAVLLLFGAGLLLRTLLAVVGVDRGYGAESVLTMIVDPLASQYPTRESQMRFFDDVEREVSAVPGVRSVAFASTLPLGFSYAGRSFFEIAGDPPPDESRRPTADYQVVSPAYFETIDVPIVSGRGFDSRDLGGAPAVCMVNEAFVRQHLRDRSPIGVQISIRPTGAQVPPVVREIVGVARQVKGRPDEKEDLVQIYVPLAQDLQGDIFLAVRPVAGRADQLAGAVRAAIGRVDKEQLVSVRSVRTLEDVAWEATSSYRFRAILVMTFAALALVLAMVGVFGILAYSVQQRVRDFGVRRALGASRADLVRLVVGGAFRVVAAGAAIGLVLAAGASRLLGTVLFGVDAWDPVTFVAVPVVLALTAAAATAGPAWRATRIDPAAALRGE
jgi:putative ABC transport system permease protein